MRVVDTEAYLDQVVAMLREGAASVPVPVAGNSMCPFLHPGDTVYLDLPTRPLRRGDIVLFTRPSGQYVLHRICQRCSDGSFLLLGDNQTVREPVPGMERIHAIVTSARCRNKQVTPRSLRWWFFAHPWRWLSPLRPWFGRILGKVKRK